MPTRGQEFLYELQAVEEENKCKGETHLLPISLVTQSLHPFMPALYQQDQATSPSPTSQRAADFSCVSFYPASSLWNRKADKASMSSQLWLQFAKV